MKHPTRRKYALMIADIIFVLIAIKMFINYNNIQLAIEETRYKTSQQEMQLEFTKNFQLPYEKSDEANLFLKHENNILLPGEVIIKFQSAPQVNTGEKIFSGQEKLPEEKMGHILSSPQESRQQFLQEKLK